MTQQTQRRLGGGALLSLLPLVFILTVRSDSGQQQLPASESGQAATAQPKLPGYYDEPDAYDLQAILADPASYYEQVIPSRVWQLAAAPAGQERHEELLIVGEAIRFVAEHSVHTLRVQAKPQRPVTFTALDQGTFTSGKQSISVPADEHGYAEVEFQVDRAGPFRVLAGSPESHGPAEFVFQALPAGELADLESGKYARDYWHAFRQSPQAEALMPQPQP